MLAVGELFHQRFVGQKLEATCYSEALTLSTV